MPLPRRFAVLASAALLTGTLVAASRPHERAVRVPPSAKAARIHAHFDSVLRELHTRDVSHLPDDQRVRRAALLSTLRDYDARGEFPNNYDFQQPTPYFVDRTTGARCAVAHLLESSGRADIVHRVARQDNNVRAVDLSADTAFTAWLHEQGITLVEAARIQPTYEGESGSVGVGTVVAVVGAAVLSIGTAVGSSIWNATGNADGHNRFGNSLGVVSGVLTTVVGAAIAGSAEGGAERTAGVATAAVGGLSLALGARGFSRRSRAKAAGREALREQDARGSREATIAPIVAVGRSPSAGVAMQIRF